MKQNKNSSDAASGIVLLAKKSGMTSFSSLSSVKRAFSTGKVGHTGTLDSFADGLLVVLVGKLTHLVPHITNFDKTYRALIAFGTETDTLDPTGTVVRTGRVPSADEVRAVLPDFCGETEQVPPLYSALHIDGRRASDLARAGKTVEIAPRRIKIHSLKLLDFFENYALVEVCCSKGTYVRSLARDIAAACGSCAHLAALRRTAVGPFLLKDAFAADELPDFTIQSILARGKAHSIDENDGKSEADAVHIRNCAVPMTCEVARLCGLVPVVVSRAFAADYMNGRPLRPFMFSSEAALPDTCSAAVFYPDGTFGGVVMKSDRKLSYGFVIPTMQNMHVYTWEQVASGKFSRVFRERGTALTVGSFDGLHAGHNALFDAVFEKSRSDGLVPGAVTFTRSLRGYKNPGAYEGDIISLSQKIDFFMERKLGFVIIIDFSTEFGKIEGHDFLRILAEECGMKYLAEGSDFHCGHGGSADIRAIQAVSGELGFSVDTIPSVFFGSEKISSSRIRKSIRMKEFADTKVMLGRPFELDCGGFVWSSHESEFGTTRSAAVPKSGMQLMPPDGTYTVAVLFYNLCQKSGEAQNVRAYHADCTLENGTLRLAFSDNLISGIVRAVRFL